MTQMTGENNSVGRPVAGETWWGGEVCTSTRGEFVCRQKKIGQEYVLAFPSLDLIRRNFRLIYGIGAKTEELLRKSGYQTLADLTGHPRWGKAAKEVINLIEERKLDRLRRYGAKDEEILGFFCGEQLVFVDLETTGFSQLQPLFLIGTMSFAGERLVIKQYLARDYAEEAAVLAGFLRDCEAKAVMVSFNGRSFDYPYLLARLAYHGFTHSFNPFQLDLLPPTRRAFRDTLPDCRLRTVEEQLLGVARHETFSGVKIPELYHRFVTEKNPRLLTEVIEHNARDLLSMAALVRLLAEEFWCRNGAGRSQGQEDR
ncbi:MAG TPA: hypothetical protein GX391_07260 [Firmicutes bacterium]|jgi:uncharacterized protein YprB with RNaseH-like and TPR domain|nr:hypothetical protein [Bacillota bacterium]HOQ23726.1 ribonuclease H-like domain-containing protein [Bacillota bacterium]HPT66870.1 ribonuclease H-like domain-containing protein [Bacillota bacterium]